MIMAKKVRKVDNKAVAKAKLVAQLREFLEEQDYEVIDAEPYGYTKGTIIVRDVDGIDVQLKPITPGPKVGDHYILEEEESDTE